MQTTKLTTEQNYILFKIQDERTLNFNETMELEKMIAENIIDYDQLSLSAIHQLEMLAEVKQEEPASMIEVYQERLDIVVALENYEEAVYFRDQINLIK
jgi:hypothetical protein